MIQTLPCPYCLNDTPQLLEWHGGVPEDHTRHTCIKQPRRGCGATWDEHTPWTEEDEADYLALNPEDT